MKLEELRKLSKDDLINPPKNDENVVVRKVFTHVRCDKHQLMMKDSFVFKHLRECTRTQSGGRSSRKIVELYPMSIFMNAINVRELIFRFMKFDLWYKVIHLKRTLHMFLTSQPTLISIPVPPQRQYHEHLLVAEMTDFEMTVDFQKIPFGKSLIGAPAILKSHAKFSFDDDLYELMVDSREYTIEGILGTGSFGSCYQVALKANSESKAACKVIKIYPEIALLIETEVELQKACHDHVNVVRLLSSFNFRNQFQLILMELCPNGSLIDLQVKHKFIDFDDLLPIVRQIMKGIEYIHSQNVIHRDLKPDNVLICENQRVKIADFSLAIKCDAKKEDVKAFCGTIPYMAPEIVNKEGAVFASDIWAIGVMVYYMYYGWRPFDNGSLDMIGHQSRIYERIRKAHYHINPAFLEPGLAHFFSKVFEIRTERRPLANEILSTPLFKYESRVQRERIPRAKETVTIVPVYILSHDKMYVHILERSNAQFEKMQFHSLQNTELKVVDAGSFVKT